MVTIMLLYISGAFALLLVIIGIWWFTMRKPNASGSTSGAASSTPQLPKSKWESIGIKNRNSGESDDAWGKRIFGALRMNPNQSQVSEPAQVNLNWLLAGKNTLDLPTASEFAKGAAVWYKDDVVKSGLATADGTVLGL